MRLILDMLSINILLAKIKKMNSMSFFSASNLFVENELFCILMINLFSGLYITLIIILKDKEIAIKRVQFCEYSIMAIKMENMIKVNVVF